MPSKTESLWIKKLVQVTCLNATVTASGVRCRLTQVDHRWTINIVGKPILNVSLCLDSVIFLACVDSSLLLTHFLLVNTPFSMAKLVLPFVLAAVSSMAAGIIVPGNNALESRSAGQSKAVIVQMFEWTWDSIASECTNFLGLAGYGYVQSALNTFPLGMIHIINTSLYISEPSSGACRWLSVVDRLSACLVYSYF